MWWVFTIQELKITHGHLNLQISPNVHQRVNLYECIYQDLELNGGEMQIHHKQKILLQEGSKFVDLIL